MAKDPCKYKLPGSDTWMSELEFKQALSDGLLDQLMIESGLSVPSLKGFSPDSNKAESYKLGRGKGQKMTEDTELKSSEAVASEKERFSQKLSNSELDALRTSIRNRFPDSYTSEVLDQVSEAIKTGESNLPFELDYLADGITLNDVAGILAQDELFESAKEAKDFLRDRAISGDLLNAKREALEEGKVSRSYEDLANKIRNIKIDTRGTAMSSLPGLVEAWNLAVEAAAKAVEVAGATADALQKGIAAAEKAFKESDFYKTLKDRDERLRYMNDLRNGIQQTLEEKKPTGKQKKAGKEFKGQVEEVTGVKPNRETVTLTEAEALKTRIKAEVAAAKAIDKIKQDVIDFAKEALPKESYSQKELNRVLAAVRRAKDEKSLNKALDSISGLVERKNEQIRKKKISDIRKKIKDKKTLYTKVDGKWRGKVTVDAQEEFNEFIGELSDLEAMSMEELTEVEEIINGIVENGRAEFNRLKAITEDRKKRQAADMLEELAVTQPSTSETMFFETFDPEMVGEPEGGPDAILSDNEAVKTFLEDRKGNIVIIDGKMYTASSYKSSKYNDKANPDPIPSPAKGYKKINLTEEKRIIEEKKTAVDKLKDSVRRVAVLDNMYGMLQKIGKGAPKTTEFINDNIVKPIQDYFIDSQVSVKERMDSYKEGLKDIFGSEKKASVRLNENASVNPLERSKEKGVGVSNSILVSLYNLSRLNNGIQRLKNSGVNTDELIEYIESNQDLLDYANFLVDQYNEMKAEYEPTYISVTGMPFPEGYYYPAYSEANFDDDVLSETDIIDPEGNFSALNAMVNNLKQRNDNAGSAFNTSLGAEEIFIDYVKNMERAKYLIPVARSANQLFAQQNRPYLVNILGPNALNELQKSLAVVFTGKRPPKDYAEGTMDKVMNYNTLITLGFKLKSIPTQMTSFINFWGEGIKDGINPLKVISAFPTNATEREFLREVAFSEYLRERRKGTSLDLEVKRMLNIKNQNAFQRVWNKLITENVMKLPGLADWLTSISPFGGGGSYAIAQLRNELSKGVPLEEAKKNAFRNFVRAVEETQQTSREDYTASFQRSTIGRMFSTYKTSQIGFARKIVSGYRTLGDPKATDTEKVQAYYDMIFYSFASSVLFSLVANGGYRVLSSLDDEDFDEKLRVIYDLAIDQAQSVAQGFGFGGFIVDEIINHARQDEWKNNVSFIQFLLNSTQSIADIYKRTTQDDLTDPKMSEEERMRFFQEMGISSEYYNDEDVEKVIQLYKESSIWRKMTPQERKNLLKTAGLKNIVEQINDFYEYSQGNQSFLDAFMNYEKDYFESAKKKGKTDYIFKKLFGEDYIPKKRPESAEPEYVGEEMKENVDKGLKLEEINN